MNRRVYCEFSFLKFFLRNIPKYSNTIQRYDPYVSWRKLFLFLCKSSILVDTTKLQFLQECEHNGFLLKLYQSNPNWKWLGSNFPHIKDLEGNKISEHNRFFSVFLTDLNKRTREEISSKLGILTLGKSDIFHFEELFEEYTTPIPKTKYLQWNDIPFNNLSKNSNSMIIADNFILDDTKLINKNFKALLETLLPDSSEIEYHLTIFAKLTGTKHSQTEKDAELRYAKALEVITEICKNKGNLICRLTIFDTDDFHDRIIVTNNVWIDCGAGFDLINSSGLSSKRTNIRIAFPFISSGKQDWVDDAFVYLLSDCKKEVNGCKRAWGNDAPENKNRLLSLVF